MKGRAFAAASRARGWSTEEGPGTTLLLLRHGQTELTPRKLFSGSGADPRLSALGRTEGEAVARHLAHGRADESVDPAHSVDAIVSSPLRRAQATAEYCARALSRPVTIDERLREMDFGLWEGLHHDEVASGWPAELAAWKSDETAAPPSGESFRDMTRRVTAARDAILGRHRGGTVLVVSHVGPIKVLVGEALGGSAQAPFRMELSPASLTVIRYDGRGTGSLRSFNDCCHLPVHTRIRP
ncbi:histidine phosphatase family protein [Kitasatospora sp. HPMI-4]|uniref:histidine phosphatase family protein n=1 Tax=Kitasatospora sp. HPMI-4 TaxID=3448443 RepID=UPI003F19DDD3